MRTIVAGLGLVLLADGIALAAPPAGPAEGGASTEPAAAGSAAATPDMEEASTHFKRGLQLFDEGDYTLALVEFERAYQLAPNYRALYNIALVDVQLGRYADAARTLEQYIHDGGAAIPPTRRDEVKKTLGELHFRTATVEISTNAAGAEVTLDGKPLDLSTLHGPMVIDAGEHTLRATSPGYQAANKTVTLAGGDRANVRLVLVSLALPHAPTEPVAETHHHLFWPGFIATGALAAGAITAGIFTLDAQSHLNTLKNTPDSSASERSTWANRQNSAALFADVFTATAVVAGGVSIYLSLRPDHAQRTTGLTLAPQRILLTGSF